jgi:transcriptional regulator with XRE-family HTH domain
VKVATISDRRRSKLDITVIGKRIQKRRKKLGLSQGDIGRELGISLQAVSKWENGYNVPDIVNMIPLCKMLKCSLEWLFTGKELNWEVM